MSDETTSCHTLTVVVTADAEAILTELTPHPWGTVPGLAAEWVGRWCRGACRRAPLDVLSWPGETLRVNIDLDDRTYGQLAILSLAFELDRQTMASAIINSTARELMAAKRRGRLTD